jgi:hypothetical protein
MAKRKINFVVGAVFGVPLTDGSRAVAQVIEPIGSLRAALCVFYSYRYDRADLYGRANAKAKSPDGSLRRGFRFI